MPFILAPKIKKKGYKSNIICPRSVRGDNKTKMNKIKDLNKQIIHAQGLEDSIL